jgi:hypothetical protein
MRRQVRGCGRASVGRARLRAQISVQESAGRRRRPVRRWRRRECRRRMRRQVRRASVGRAGLSSHISVQERAGRGQRPLHRHHRVGGCENIGRARAVQLSEEVRRFASLNLLAARRLHTAEHSLTTDRCVCGRARGLRAQSTWLNGRLTSRSACNESHELGWGARAAQAGGNAPKRWQPPNGAFQPQSLLCVRLAKPVTRVPVRQMPRPELVGQGQAAGKPLWPLPNASDVLHTT